MEEIKHEEIHKSWYLSFNLPWTERANYGKSGKEGCRSMPMVQPTMLDVYRDTVLYLRFRSPSQSPSQCSSVEHFAELRTSCSTYVKGMVDLCHDLSLRPMHLILCLARDIFVPEIALLPYLPRKYISVYFHLERFQIPQFGYKIGYN